MGLGRGMAHVAGWLKVPGVEVVGLSEVDERRLAEGVKAVAAGGQTVVPRVERDFRRLLEDPGIDVLSIAAPNFWQTPAAGATVMLDSSSCHLRKGSDAHALVTFYGDGGAMALSSSGYRIYDEAGKETGRSEPAFSDVPHFQNLADAIRDGKPLNAAIETGQRSALVCHLGNVAYRTGGVVDYDAATGVMKGGPEVQALWGREYRDGWQVRVD